MPEQFLQEAENELEQRKNEAVENFSDHMKDLSGPDFTMMVYESKQREVADLKEKVREMEEELKKEESDFQATESTLNKKEKKDKTKKLTALKEELGTEKEILKSKEEEEAELKKEIEDPKKLKEKLDAMISEQGHFDRREIARAERVLNTEMNNEIADLANPERIREIFGEKRLDTLFDVVIKHYQETTSTKREKGWKSRQKYWQDWYKSAEGFQQVGINNNSVLEIISAIERQIDSDAVDAVQYLDSQERIHNQEEEEKKGYIKEEESIKGKAKEYTKKTWKYAKGTMKFGGKMGARVGMYMGIGAAAAGAAGFFTATAAFAPIAGVTAPLAVRTIGMYRNYAEKRNKLEKQKKQTAESYRGDLEQKEKLKKRVLEMIAEEKAQELREERSREGLQYMNNRAMVRYVESKHDAKQFIESEGYDKDRADEYISKAESGDIESIKKELIKQSQEVVYNELEAIFDGINEFLDMEENEARANAENEAIEQLKIQGIEVTDEVLEIVNSYGAYLPSVMNELERKNIIPVVPDLQDNATDEQKQTHEAQKKQRKKLEELMDSLVKNRYIHRNRLKRVLSGKYFDFDKVKYLIELLTNKDEGRSKKINRVINELVGSDPSLRSLINTKILLDKCEVVQKQKQLADNEAIAQGVSARRIEDEIQFYHTKKLYIDSIILATRNENAVEKRTQAYNNLHAIAKKILPPKELAKEFALIESGKKNQYEIEYLLKDIIDQKKNEVNTLKDLEESDPNDPSVRGFLPDYQKIQQKLDDYGFDKKATREFLNQNNKKNISMREILQFMDNYFQGNKISEVVREFIAHYSDSSKEQSAQDNFEKELEKKAESMKPKMRLISAKVVLQKELAKNEHSEPQNRQQVAKQAHSIQLIQDLMDEIDKTIREAKFDDTEDLLMKTARLTIDKSPRKPEEEEEEEEELERKADLDIEVNSMVRSSILLFKADQRNQAMNEALELQLSQYGDRQKHVYAYQEMNRLKQEQLKKRSGVNNLVVFLEKALNFQKNQREKTSAAMLAAGATIRYGKILDFPGLREYGSNIMFGLSGGMIGIQLADLLLQKSLGEQGKINHERMYRNVIGTLDILDEEVSLDKIQAENFNNIAFDAVQYSKRLAEMKSIQKKMEMDKKDDMAREVGGRIRKIEQRIAMYTSLLAQRKRVEEQYAKIAKETKQYADDKESRSKQEVKWKAAGFVAGALTVNTLAEWAPEAVLTLKDRLMADEQTDARVEIEKEIKTNAGEPGFPQAYHAHEADMGHEEEIVKPQFEVDSKSQEIAPGQEEGEIINEEGIPKNTGVVTETISSSSSHSKVSLEQGFAESQTVEPELVTTHAPEVKVAMIETDEEDENNDLLEEWANSEMKSHSSDNTTDMGERAEVDNEDVIQQAEGHEEVTQEISFEEKVSTHQQLTVGEIVRNAEKLHLSREESVTFRHFKEGMKDEPIATYEVLGGEYAKVYDLGNGMKAVEISNSFTEEPYRSAVMYGDGKYALVNNQTSTEGMSFVDRDRSSANTIQKDLKMFDMMANGEEIHDGYTVKLTDFEVVDKQETLIPKSEYTQADIKKYYNIIKEGNFSPDKVTMDVNSEKPIIMNIGSKEVALGYDGEKTKMLIFEDNEMSQESLSEYKEALQRYQKGEISFDKFAKEINDNVRYSKAIFHERDDNYDMTLYTKLGKVEIEKDGTETHETSYTERDGEYTKRKEVILSKEGTPEQTKVETRLNEKEELEERMMENAEGKLLLQEKYNDGDLEQVLKYIYKSNALKEGEYIKEIYEQGKGAGDLDIEDLKNPVMVNFYDKDGVLFKEINNTYMKGGLFESQQGFLKEQIITQENGNTVRTPLRTSRLGGIYGYREVFTQARSGNQMMRETLLASDNSSIQEAKFFVPNKNGEMEKIRTTFEEEGPNGRSFRIMDEKKVSIEGEDGETREIMRRSNIYYDRSGQHIQGRFVQELKTNPDGTEEWKDVTRLDYKYDEDGKRIGYAHYAINDNGVVTSIKEVGEKEVVIPGGENEYIDWKKTGEEKEYKTTGEIRSFMDTQDVYRDGKLIIDREPGKYPIKYEYKNGHVEKMKVFSPDGKRVAETWQVDRDKDGVPKGFRQVAYADDMSRRTVVYYDYNGESKEGYTEIKARSVISGGVWMFEKGSGFEGQRYAIEKMMQHKKSDIFAPDYIEQ